MQPSLSITADWERLDEGAPEERACFASVVILANNQLLTEAHDGFVNRIRAGPLISAYHLAEWLAWNWWRLRCEPRSNAADWPFAHRPATIGEGSVWPNITIFSDGERTALIARPTSARPATAFRYISNHVAIVPSAVFESEVDRFIDQVLGQLQAERLVRRCASRKNWATRRYPAANSRSWPALKRARSMTPARCRTFPSRWTATGPMDTLF